MISLVSVPILLFTLLLQSVVVSNLTLISGCADLMLLVLVAWALQDQAQHALIWALIGGVLVTFVSAAPFYAPLAGYLLIVGLTRLLKRRIWQVPILAMFVATLVGTLIQHTINIVALFVAGTPLPFQASFSLVTLPSMLLNMLFSLPVYVVVSDVAKWLYPVEVEI